jgi:hypothetical protein
MRVETTISNYSAMPIRNVTTKVKGVDGALVRPDLPACMQYSFDGTWPTKEGMEERILFGEAIEWLQFTDVNGRAWRLQESKGVDTGVTSEADGTIKLSRYPKGDYNFGSAIVTTSELERVPECS